MNETVTFTGPRMTVAPQPPKTFIDADVATKAAPHATVQAISTIVDGAKSKLEILEERIRAIGVVEAMGSVMWRD